MRELTSQQIENIRKNPDKKDWYILSCDYKLSEDFIREFQDKVNWYWISKYQKLSEDFIREFQDKVNWYYVSVRQKLSEEFFLEFKDRFFTYGNFKVCCYRKNYNNVKLFLKHGMKLNDELRKELCEN